MKNKKNPCLKMTWKIRRSKIYARLFRIQDLKKAWRRKLAINYTLCF